MRKFGLIGEHLPHSFSGKYFTAKFEREGIEGCVYSLYELPTIDHLEELLSSTPQLAGFNVTIPYKQQVMKYLTKLSVEAEAVGAVNCVKIDGDDLIGYNTDIIGFKSSLLNLLNGARPDHALILGTGGASLAVEYILKEIGVEYSIISRKAGEGRITYGDLDAKTIAENKLIINATPVGTYPDVDNAPDIPYEFLTKDHFLYDLVYNPPLTKFLASGRSQGAAICNGEAMLIAQAESAWTIWNE
ncbi:MAG: shikimate dehydrogenase [Rikenellaceae bacterium]